MARLAEEAGVPPGVVNVLTTTPARPGGRRHAGRSRGCASCPSPARPAVGRTLLAEAAKTVVSCSMELGGNAPFVVFDDADLDAALDGAMVAKMRNAGEACTAANRFYVQDGIHDAFVAGLTAADGRAEGRARHRPRDAMRPDDHRGRPCRRSTAWSPTPLRAARGSHRRRAPAGATGFYYPPTVLENVPTDAADRA